MCHFKGVALEDVGLVVGIYQSHSYDNAIRAFLMRIPVSLHILYCSISAFQEILNDNPKLKTIIRIQLTTILGTPD